MEKGGWLAASSVDFVVFVVFCSFCCFSTSFCRFPLDRVNGDGRMAGCELCGFCSFCSFL